MASIDARAHANLCDFTRFLARLEPSSLLHDEAGVVALRGESDWPSARMALRSDDDLPAAAFAGAVDEFLLRAGKTACVYTRVGMEDDATKLFAAQGFQEYAQTPEMVCEQRLEDRDPPDGTTVRLATTPADVHAYAQIAGEAFAHLGLPAEITAKTIDNPEVMLQPDVAISLADIDGAPVAGACSILFGPPAAPIGYVGWVACADSARGNGLGDVVTRLVTNVAFDRGAELVTLEASRFGEHTYARMGYRELYRYRLLIKV